MPAGIVEHEDYGSLRSGTSLPRKRRQQRGKERLRDAIMQVPPGLSRRMLKL
jgi:hypothetical protein